jgi:hypothetical protein
MLYKQTGCTDSRYAGRQRGNLEQAGCSGYPRREVQESSAIPVHSRLPAEDSWTPAWESRAVANLPDDDRMYVKSTSHWPLEVTVPIAKPTPPFRHSCFRYLLLPAILKSAPTRHAGTRAAGTRTCRYNADKPHAANRQEGQEQARDAAAALASQTALLTHPRHPYSSLCRSSFRMSALQTCSQ